jgi:hypothetical protein
VPFRPGPSDHCPGLSVKANTKLHLHLLGLPGKILQLAQGGIGEHPDLIQCALKALPRLDHHVIDPSGPFDARLVIGHLNQQRSAARLELQQLLHRSPSQ